MRVYVVADNTAIEWTHRPGTKGETWNPTVGCSILSPGCTHCYAMGEAARQIRCAAGLKRDTHYAGTVKTVKGRSVWTGKVNLAPDHILTKPLRWRQPRTVFVNSMSDLFHESICDEWIDKVFAVMALSPQHTFQVLTKRAERMRSYMTAPGRFDDVLRARDTIVPAWDSTIGYDWPQRHVWLGVSTERQQEADERIPLLLQTPATVRFISAEPLLGPISLTNLHPPGAGIPADANGHNAIWTKNAIGRAWLDWVIVGGESGHGARPMHPDWARSLRDQCAAADVRFFFKQWGEFAPLDTFSDAEPDAHVYRVGKKKAGRLLDGKEHNAFPQAKEVVFE